jgi:L-alanine-DL-glutamate epimerase-like enolase superfamily enzyme
VRGGRMPIPDRPGHGVALDEARVAPHLFARVGK